MPRVPNLPPRCLRDTCGVSLVPQRSRGDCIPIPHGHREHAGRGLCDICHRWARQRPERLKAFPPLIRDRRALLARWAELRDAGHTYASAAPLLSTSTDALRQVVYRTRCAPVAYPLNPDTRDEGE